MSDIPPPPGAPPPPPPPPPPHLTQPPMMAPPPGYAAYATGPIGQVPLRRIGALARALVVATIAAGAANLVSALLSLTAVDEAEDFLAGVIDEDAFLEAYTPAVLFGLVQSTAFLATIVLTMVWMFRTLANHKVLGRVGTWGPGWAIGGWFLPPLILYVIPFLVLREMWRGSDPDVALGDDRWKRGPVAPVVTAWWVLYGLVPLVLLAVQGAQAISRGVGATDTEDIAETVRDQVGVSLASSALTIAAAVAWILVVRGITSRHRRLTGEATAAR